MIRRLTEDDRAMCMAFLQKAPAENLFIIGDIEAYGFKTVFQDVWGYVERNILKDVILRYRENYLVYSSNDSNAMALAQFLNDRLIEGTYLSGINHMVNPILMQLEKKPIKPRETYYAKCESLHALKSPEGTVVNRLTPEDVHRVIALYDLVPEFEDSADRETALVRSLKDGVARGCYIEKDGKLISVAMTAAENSMSAMIVGVATHPDAKRQGYATLCMQELCRELLDEGKYLCLFYDNPDAGAIYKRLGFEDIGMWAMNGF